MSATPANWQDQLGELWRTNSTWIVELVAFVAGLYVVFTATRGAQSPGAGYLLGLASLAAGATFGFLFGVPRSLQHNLPPGDVVVSSRHPGAGSPAGAPSDTPGSQPPA